MTVERGRGRRGGEGGYALLAVLLGAAMLSIFLVRMLPREAMSAQRIREQNLIDRGEQYARAIKLYFREHKKYPQRLDDLENTNGVRYLRRRYRDPITGQDEWRLVRMGSDGRFKDSLIYDTEDNDPRLDTTNRGGRRPGGTQTAGIVGMDPAAYQALYGTPAPSTPGVFPGARRALAQRQSAAPDNPLQSGPAGFETLGPGAEDSGEPLLGPDGRPLPREQQPGTDFSRVRPGQVPEDAGQRPPQPAGLQPGSFPPDGFQPGTAFARGSARGRSAFGTAGRAAQQQQATQPGAPQPTAGPVEGYGVQGISPDAASIIGRLLTTPRPGGLQGLQGAGAMQPGPQAQPFQEGIAGVASKAADFGVKVYKGRRTYNEWEFVYDYRQDQAFGGAPGAPPAPAGNINPAQPGLGLGGTLSGAPGAFPGLPGTMPGIAPGGSDPRPSPFGGVGGPTTLPPIGTAPVDSGPPPAPEQPTDRPPPPYGQTGPPPAGPNAPPAEPSPQPPPPGRQLTPSRFGIPRPPAPPQP